MAANNTVSDAARAKEATARGRRSKWWHRKGSMKRGFSYTDADGKSLKSKGSLERIKGLVIPPAWGNVRINPAGGGKVQAIGVDTTGRMQYIYNPKYADKQQRKKFSRIETFGKYLPKLKEVTNEHLSLKGLPREKVLAVIMRLINSLYFRVGTDHSEKNYKTFGITTLQKRHLVIGNKGKLEFNFVGKSHVEHRKILVDMELASVIKQMIALGRGRKLFRYLDENGKPRAVSPAQINRYIRGATDDKFTSKDFRTWGGSLMAAAELAEIGTAEKETEIKKNIVKAIKKVAESLGNTPTVCRGSYVHPSVIKCYQTGVTLDEFRPKRRRRAIKGIQPGLEPEEKALLKMFERCGK